LSGGLRAVIKVGVGRALHKGGFIETLLGSLEARSVDVNLVLSILASCFSRSIAEKLGINNVEVTVELYEDLDALLDGDLENVNMLKVKVRAEGASMESVEKALEGCPFYVILKPRIKMLEVDRW